MKEFLLTFLGTCAGALTAVFTAEWTARLRLRFAYDAGLRKARLLRYQKLWRELEPLAKYARLGPVTQEVLKTLTTRLREWYFRVGGMYLSSRSRDAYFHLQDACASLLERPEVAFANKPELDPDVFEALRKKGSTLRTAMAQDVLSREAPELASRAGETS